MNDEKAIADYIKRRGVTKCAPAYKPAPPSIGWCGSMLPAPEKSSSPEKRLACAKISAHLMDIAQAGSTLTYAKVWCIEKARWFFFSNSDLWFWCDIAEYRQEYVIAKARSLMMNNTNLMQRLEEKRYAKKTSGGNKKGTKDTTQGHKGVRRARKQRLYAEQQTIAPA
jgi:hypothetical protein